MADPSSDDTLTFVNGLVTQNTGTVARLMGDGLYAKGLANADANAHLPPTSTLWDQIVDFTVQLEQEPGLLEDVMRVLGGTSTVPLATAFSSYMTHIDHISYDRNNLNGLPFNVTTNDGSRAPRRP